MDMSVAGLAYAFEPTRQNREPGAYQSWLDEIEALNESVVIVVVAALVSWIGRTAASLRGTQTILVGTLDVGGCCPTQLDDIGVERHHLERNLSV